MFLLHSLLTIALTCLTFFSNWDNHITIHQTILAGLVYIKAQLVQEDKKKKNNPENIKALMLSDFFGSLPQICLVGIHYRNHPLKPQKTTQHNLSSTAIKTTAST